MNDDLIVHPGVELDGPFQEDFSVCSADGDETQSVNATLRLYFDKGLAVPGVSRDGLYDELHLAISGPDEEAIAPSAATFAKLVGSKLAVPGLKPSLHRRASLSQGRRAEEREAKDDEYRAEHRGD